VLVDRNRHKYGITTSSFPSLTSHNLLLLVQRLATGWTIGIHGVRFLAGVSPLCPARLWCPPRLLSKWVLEAFPWGWSDRGVKLTTHLHLVPRSKNAWSYTSTPQYVFMAWCLV